MTFFRLLKTRERAALGLVLGLIFLLGAPVAQARTVVKIATLVPDGSIWGKTLKEMGAEWQERTDGEVSLRIYANGVAGDEPDLVRKMRIGQLHAAAISVGGLTAIDNSFEIFKIPMFFSSYDELYHVLEEMRPTLESRLQAKGYRLIHWGHGGWVHIFSKEPVGGPGDLRQQKLFVWAGDDNQVQQWRRHRFQPVPLSATDILTSLQTGMISALPTTPLAALSLQWFRQTPYMQGLGMAPLVGATVMTEKTWKRLSPEDQKAVQQAAADTEKELLLEIPKQDQRAIDQMVESGMKLVEVSAENEAQWRNLAEEFTQHQLQHMEAKDLLRQALDIRNAYRAKQKDSGE